MPDSETIEVNESEMIDILKCLTNTKAKYPDLVDLAFATLDKTESTELKTLCVDFIINQDNLDNVINIITNSGMNYNDALINKIGEYVIKKDPHKARQLLNSVDFCYQKVLDPLIFQDIANSIQEILDALVYSPNDTGNERASALKQVIAAVFTKNQSSKS
jgi:hypothetical protein